MDFMSDALQTKRKFRILNIMSDFNCKAISIEADFSFSSKSVVEALKRAIHENGKPARIRVGNGPEFISSTLFDWCKEENIHFNIFSQVNLCRMALLNDLTELSGRMY